MTIQQLLDRLAELISGVRAKRNVGEISRFHRIQGSPGYDDAIAVVQDALTSAGVESRVLNYPADGASKTYGWTAPPAWHVRSGVLRLVEPHEETLATYEEIPQTIVVHSPGGSGEAELVHVGKGTRDQDYPSVTIADKVILAHGKASEVMKQAVTRHARAILIYPDSARASAAYDLVQYQGLFPLAAEIPSLVPAFSLSRRVADHLLRLMDDGPVRVAGDVDAEFISSELRVLEAVIPGDDPTAGEVLLSAHLCHPAASANDNASGSAALIEAALALQAIRFELPLRHTIRLIWVPEFYGTLPWAAANCETLSRTHYALNLDMVGQSPEAIGEPLQAFRVPRYVTGTINAFVEPLLTAIASDQRTLSPHGSRRMLHWRLAPPTGGSDHLVVAASPHHVPALMIGHDDPFWHTDLDTLDKVDATRLKQAALFAAACASIPSVAAENAEQLAEWLLTYSVRSLSDAHQLARAADPERGAALMSAALQTEHDRADGLARILPSFVVRPYQTALEMVVAYLDLDREAPPPAPCETAAIDHPMRAVDGPLVYAFTDQLGEEDLAFFKRTLGSDHRFPIEAILNLCDGDHSLDEIADLLSLDLGRLFAAEDVARGIEILRSIGYVAQRPSRG
ncbi:DUF4910 domain-containing protein [Candidatus Bipolaricaulota bacterium]|nr:DUF4910 domain-containing protein [Candidatus Bipolaricaulota bacterium]